MVKVVKNKDLGVFFRGFAPLLVQLLKPRVTPDSDQFAVAAEVRPGGGSCKAVEWIAKKAEKGRNLLTISEMIC